MADPIQTETFLADLNNDVQVHTVRSLLDAFARDPSGQSAPIEPRLLEQTTAMLAAHPGARILVACHNGRPAGIATCYLGFATFSAARTLHIHDLFVEGQTRGRGVGRALIEACADQARADECTKLTIEALMNNRSAIRLYEAAGFGPFSPQEGMGLSTTLVRAL